MPPLRAKRVTGFPGVWGGAHMLMGGNTVMAPVHAPATKSRNTEPAPRSCGGREEWFQVYMVNSIHPNITGVHIVEIPLAQEAIDVIRSYPTTAGFAKEVGGPLLPVQDAPNQPGLWVQFPFPDPKSYANSLQNRVRVPAHWPLSFHSHPNSCTRIPDNPGHEMCAIFTPSATDFRSLFENPANLSHIVANDHGMYAINTPLHTCVDKEHALIQIQALQDRYAAGEFGKGANEDKKYHKAYMELCADLGLCVEFWPWQYRSKVGESPKCYPRLLVPAHKLHMVYRDDYPSERTWGTATDSFMAYTARFIAGQKADQKKNP